MGPSKPLSQKIVEVCAASLILGLVPIVFIFDFLFVLPQIHTKGDLPYITYVVFGIFFLANLESNFIACMATNTSVDYKRLPISVCKAGERKSWTRYCRSCHQMSPPGSYHCSGCGICILKRHHHCIFTGCCIGHRNQRYFIFFIMYLFALSALSLTYDVICAFLTHKSFLWRVPNYIAFLRLSLFENIQLIFFNLKIASAFFSGVALFYYLSIVLRGQVISYESQNSMEISKKDKDIYRNLKSVFGERVCVAWISPTLKSELPEDGYN